MCRKTDTVLIVRVRVQNYHVYVATVTNICVRSHGVIESSFWEVKPDPCLITVISGRSNFPYVHSTDIEKGLVDIFFLVVLG